MDVGDYVRTKDGIIAKITDIIDDYSIDCDRDVFDLDNIAMMEIPYYFKDEYIIKSSPNIIDLIEVGDYVNGGKVICKYDYILGFDGGQDGEYYINEGNIESIVTHEQFSQMEYMIGE